MTNLLDIRMMIHKIKWFIGLFIGSFILAQSSGKSKSLPKLSVESLRIKSQEENDIFKKIFRALLSIANKPPFYAGLKDDLF